MTWCKSTREGAQSRFGPCLLHSRAANGPALPVAVEQNTTLHREFKQQSHNEKQSTPDSTFVFDELTLVIVLPQRLEHGFIGKYVVFAQKRFQVPSSFRAMIYPVG